MYVLGGTGVAPRDTVIKRLSLQLRQTTGGPAQHPGGTANESACLLPRRGPDGAYMWPIPITILLKSYRHRPGFRLCRPSGPSGTYGPAGGFATTKEKARFTSARACF
jgi:hypothetical protein